MLVNKKNIEVFLRNLNNCFKNKCLFLIGAGVSSHYIKPDYCLYQKIKEKLARINIFEPIISSNNMIISKQEMERLELIGGSPVLNKVINEVTCPGISKPI